MSQAISLQAAYVQQSLERTLHLPQNLGKSLCDLSLTFSCFGVILSGDIVPIAP